MNACMYVFIHAYVGAYMLLIYVKYCFDKLYI